MITLRNQIATFAVLGAAALAAPLTAQQTAASNDEPVVLEKYEVSEMKAFSDQAIPGRTPVAFTELGKETISAELGSRDIPLVLNSSPSVFATTDSGGAGDARVNIRGFSQRNVSILINGVPTNDLENGWLYWSNWDGLGDVTSTIQVQRGLSNVALPTPSVGGTMNIITDPASSKRGGSAKVEFGSDQFYKFTGVLNTGLLADKFALTVGGVAKTGEGYANGTYTRGLGYYVGATWKVNPTNRLELFAIGAPQRHGQRSFASNIAAYSVDYARSLGFTNDQIFSTASGANAGAARQGPVDAGFAYNQNVAPVSSSYTGQQYYWGGLHSREDPDHIHERENYFHKPQVNLNWYSNISDKLNLTSVFYYSGGRGGGSGTLNNGSSSAAFARYPNDVPKYGSNINWDATIASNAGAVAANGSKKTAGQALGILRNSVNNQDQFGIVSRLTYDLTPEWKITGGVDWRTADIDHFREVRDLLGGSYYLPTTAQASEFWADGANTKLGLGDKVDYSETNTVDWLSLFAKAEYQNGPISAYGIYGWSTIGYTFTDHFRRAAPGSSEEYKIDPGMKKGDQIKGGINYEITKNLSVFGNAGWVSKVPIFDGVINDIVGARVAGVTNEKFNSYEGGVRFHSDDRKLTATLNYYYTEWRNRTISVTNESADTITYLRNVSQNSAGWELEAQYRVNNWVSFDAATSVSNWRYMRDVVGDAYSISSGAQISSSAIYYIKGLKVGDAPQTQYMYGVTVRPVHGLRVQLQGRQYERYWSDFTPDSRILNDRGDSWRIPSYAIYDLHVNYNLPLQSDRFDVALFAHFFNLFDKVYISDATDESSFEAVGTALAPRHSAQRAEVFFGAPFSFDAGVTISF